MLLGSEFHEYKVGMPNAIVSHLALSLQELSLIALLRQPSEHGPAYHHRDILQACPKP